MRQNEIDSTVITNIQIFIEENIEDLKSMS